MLLGYVDAVKHAERINHARRMFRDFLPAELSPLAYLTGLAVPHDALVRVIGASVKAHRHDADTMRRWSRYPREFRRQLVALEADLPVIALQRMTPGKPLALVEPPTATPEAWPVTAAALPDCLRRGS